MIRYRILIGALLIACLQSGLVLAQGTQPPIPPVPTNGNVVLDELNWLSPTQESEINSLNQKLDAEGIAQIAVVTLNDCGDDAQKFRNELFRTWGIGHPDTNDGLLILVCWYGGDQSRRSVEQETGYGLEGPLPDVLTARTVDEVFIPAFQANRPGDGLVAMVKSYDQILRQEMAVRSSANPVDINMLWIITGFLAILPGLVLIITYYSFRAISTGLMSHPSTVTDKPDMFETISTSGRSNFFYNFALAENLALLPILGVIFFINNGLFSVALPIQQYGRFAFPILIAWFILLTLFYLSRFFQNHFHSNPWETETTQPDPYDHNHDQNQNSDLLDTLVDIAGDLSSFGGGKSGGGGSSKKF